MATTIRSTLALFLLLALQPVSAESIARWVDADGVTHFGNPQFAPAGAKMVEVAPTNGMAVPENVPSRQASTTRWSLITRAPRKLTPLERVGNRNRNRRGATQVYRTPAPGAGQSARKSASTFR